MQPARLFLAEAHIYLPSTHIPYYFGPTDFDHCTVTFLINLLPYYIETMSESEDDIRTRAVCDFFGKIFFSVTNPPEDLSDLCDGVVMFEALSEM